MSASAIAAAIPAFMTFICALDDPSRSNLSYVVSFETKGNRINDLVVLWPNGSQSHDRWKGKVTSQGFLLERRERYSSASIDLAWSADNRNTGKLTSKHNVWGGHIVMESEDTATCVVRSEADTIGMTQ